MSLGKMLGFSLAYVGTTTAIAALDALALASGAGTILMILLLVALPVGVFLIRYSVRHWTTYSGRSVVPLLVLTAGIPLFFLARASGARHRHERFVRDIPLYEEALMRLERDSSFKAGPLAETLLPPSAYRCCTVLAASRDSSGRIRGGFLMSRFSGYVFDRTPPHGQWGHYERVAPNWYRVSN